MKAAFLIFSLLTSGVAMQGHSKNFEPWPLNVIAVATPCNYAGYDGSGSLINTNITCGGGSGGGVTSIVAGVCTSPSPVPSPTGAVAINYTCATPGPQATPSPTAGTNITISGSWPYTISASGGGGSGLPYNVVQEQWCSGTSTCTATLPQAAASSGNTLLAVVAVGAASCSGVGVTGFTAFENANDGAATSLCLFTAASSSQTSVALTGGAAGSTMYVAELTGSRTADAIATATPAGGTNETFPAITAGATSMAFFIGGYPDNGTATSLSLLFGGTGAAVENASFDNTTTSNGRDLVVGIRLGSISASTVTAGLNARLTAPFTSNHFVAMSLTIK